MLSLSKHEGRWHVLQVATDGLSFGGQIGEDSAGIFVR
jgi:hypothetical protein